MTTKLMYQIVLLIPGADCGTGLKVPSFFSGLLVRFLAVELFDCDKSKDATDGVKLISGTTLKSE